MPRHAEPKPGEPIELIKKQDGTVVYRAVVDVNAKGTPRKQAKRTFETLTAARTWVAEVQAKRRAGQRVFVAPKTTVEELTALWLASRRDIRAKSRDGYKSVLKNVNRRIGDRPAALVTPEEIDALLGWLREHGSRRPMNGPLARSSVAYCLTGLSQVFDFGVRRGIVQANPCDGARMERETKAERKKRTTVIPWTPAEYRQFTEYVDLTETDPTMRAAYRLSLCGLRRGEVLGAAWGSVNWKTGGVRIEASRCRVDGEDVLDDPKSEASNRTVWVEVACPGTLATLRAAYEAQTETLGREPGPEDPIVVVRSRRKYEKHLPPKPLALSTYSGRFREMCKAAGVRQIKLHAIRHTWASIWLRSGGGIAEGAKFLGHRVEVFISTYCQTDDESAEDALKRVAAYMWDTGAVAPGSTTPEAGPASAAAA